MGHRVAVANEGDITVALDVNIDRELELEGWAKEFVRTIQNLRKDAGLNVDDRIHVRYSVSETLEEAIAQHYDTIAGETLALELTPDNTLIKDPVMIGEWECHFEIVRAEIAN